LHHQNNSHCTLLMSKRSCLTSENIIRNQLLAWIRVNQATEIAIMLRSALFESRSRRPQYCLRSIVDFSVFPAKHRIRNYIRQQLLPCKPFKMNSTPVIDVIYYLHYRRQKITQVTRRTLQLTT
jgi:hypothetical protein